MNDQTKEPVDLTPWKMVIVKLKGETTPVSLALDEGQVFIVSPAIGGKIEVNLSQMDTDRLAVGEEMPIEVELLNDEGNRIIHIEEAIDVIERL
jgi:hypothetical protein